jgi:5-(carboxyamino)imidazole ribonucleotide synthase
VAAGPILPGSTIGIIGGGQLGRMFTMEARRMGYRVIVLDPAADSPAAQLADQHIRAPLDDADAARELARLSDVITLEWESADAEVVRELAESTPVRPGAHVLSIAQHRVREKDAARALGLDTPNYRPVTSLDELRAALEDIGTPAILKTARGGYDGKGQWRIRTRAEAERSFADALSDAGQRNDGPHSEAQPSRGYSRTAGDPLEERTPPDLILEEMVDFRMETSVLCARSPNGEMAAFPISENLHRNGILDVTVVPARLPERVLREARRIGETLTEGLDVVGLLAVELFVTADDRLLVNEIAPRPHNSGHYSWEACSVSQFEQQLRAVCGLPLQVPTLLRPAAMANLLGEHLGTGDTQPGFAAALGVVDVAIHFYGKSQARPDRKMGHLTGLGDSVDEALDRVLEARGRLAARTG